MFGKRFSRALAITTVASLVMATVAFANDKLTSDASLLTSGLQQSYSNSSLAAGVTAGFSFSLYVEVQSGGTEPDYPITVDIASKPTWVTPVTAFPVTISGTGTANAVSVSFTATGQPSAASGVIEFRAIDNGVELGQNIINTNAQSMFAVSVSPPIVSDATAPAISYVVNPASPDGTNGWYTSDVTLTWTVTENESSASLVKTGCVDQNVTTDQTETTYSCSATSAGGSAGPVSVAIKRDATDPTITGAASPAPNGAGWNNSDVTVSFTCGDATSGVATCEPAQTLSGEGGGQSAIGSAVDNAGNSASTTVSGISIDKTAPAVSLVGGPADGASYYFGAVPAAPTCSASDALSGLDGTCSVAGYAATVGSHTVTASASDLAGNSASDSASYDVLAWETYGFYRPVDMGTSINTVKGGSTVPLKFEVFAGTEEFTSTAIVAGFKASETPCGTLSWMAADEIEITSTGGTTLRYDSTEGQFIQNWKVPNTKGLCYSVVVTFQDGSSIHAYFKTK